MRKAALLFFFPSGIFRAFISGTMLNRLKLLDFLLFYDLCASFCRAGSYVGSLSVPGRPGGRTAVCLKGQEHCSTLQNTGQKQNTIEQRNIFWAPVGKAIIQTSDGDKQNKRTEGQKNQKQITKTKQKTPGHSITNSRKSQKRKSKQLKPNNKTANSKKANSKKVKAAQKRKQREI